jgi:hypothetical protein
MSQPGQLTLFRAPDPDPRYDHVWRTGRPHKKAAPYSPQLKGRRCRVRCRGRGAGPWNVAVELDDGTLICATRWSVRRVTP